MHRSLTDLLHPARNTLFGVGSVILLGEERMNNPIRGDIIVVVNA
ncbi:hypothetical protein [Burkholderia sp. RF2-non_BP3]|nr:hypothetical protein [Burkholderia sp. RF2-non_BP3]